MLALTCACGARFEVEETWAGKTVPCPDCTARIAVPALAPRGRPISRLALTSALLALFGAFTVVGTLAAVVVGLVALIRLARRREVAGLGYAVFGVSAGVLFTGLTIAVLRSAGGDFVAGYFRASQWADKLDTTGPLEIDLSEKSKHFKITRPSRDWGVVKDNRLGQSGIDALRSQGADLLLMKPAKLAFVDVAAHPSQDPHIEEYRPEDLRADLMPPPKPDNNPNDGRPDVRPDGRPGAQTGPRITIEKVESVGETKSNGNLVWREFVVELKSGDQRWTMLVRRGRPDAGQVLFILRAFAPSHSFAAVEPELRKVLDSFKLP
jgi:hypothetical protein